MELALLQHLTLLLGHPIFTLSILLFTLLLFGGLGSSRSAGVAAFVGVPGASRASAWSTPSSFRGSCPLLLPLQPSRRGSRSRWLFVGAPRLRHGHALSARARPGLEGGPAAPPFYWGLNGILSVAGSLGTMVVAVTCGFTVAMLAGLRLLRGWPRLAARGLLHCAARRMSFGGR